MNTPAPTGVPTQTDTPAQAGVCAGSRAAVTRLLHTGFSEVMAGRMRPAGARASQAMRLELDVHLPETLQPCTDAHARMSGRVLIEGLADDPAATGDLHIAPLTRRRVRYRMDFTALDGRRLHLDGWKSVSLLRPLRSMTTLPATLTDEDGTLVGEALLRFDMLSELWPMLRSLRLTRNAPPAESRADPGIESDADTDTGADTDADTDTGADAGAGAAGADAGLRPRWTGERGRLEVWYTTLTDPATGTGLWIHHELVAPHDGGAPYLHGWAAAFPPGRPPRLVRFGPEEGRHAREDDGHILRTAGTALTPRRLTGRTDEMEWDLTVTPGSGPLFTFPRWAWDSGLLPGAQIVPHCGATYDGTVRHGDEVLHLRDAPGATAHIYGHGNAHRWAWLHADLGNGDVAEVVLAVSTKPGLRHLPPLPFVRLRVDGHDLPGGDTLLAATRLRGRIDLPTWRVWGRLGDHRIDITVTLPEAETLPVDYTDPDGAPAVCHNTERATAEIRLGRRHNGRWRADRHWRLDGTAHAEVGVRD